MTFKSKAKVKDLTYKAKNFTFKTKAKDLTFKSKAKVKDLTYKAKNFTFSSKAKVKDLTY